MSSTYGSGRLSREDYKKQKELEAARMAGTAPPERDADGNEINPHIPEFMSKAPWYLDTGKLGLQHQRKAKPTTTTSISESKWYSRGSRVGSAPKKYRPGACTNCGAMSHKAKDCMERPRKTGAKWTGRDMMADEAVESVNLSYDAKRDMWNGYDATQHKNLMHDWELVEEARRKRKASELDKGTAEGGPSEPGANSIEAQFASSDEDDDDDDTNVKSKSTVRNLRIREDTAKYLRNLDPDSAYYDPKTRSMRENPYAGKDPSQLAYAGDNFIRYSGDAQDILKREVFAWEAGERGNSSAHLQANPTQTALLYKEFKGKTSEIKSTRQQEILAKYGGEEHLQAPPRELLHQEEVYVEYSRTGEVIGGVEPQVGRTRYKEDVYVLNHSSVFGSWWSDGKWGYKCCKQTMKNSYCTATLTK
ncbi:mRNA splicing protein [Coemansia sp. RSA 1822]|nr:mRNA splicing protein [Coemansia sp. RSA 638]KAJ2544918.1 mRNA splicing protein [Coemansia sp. RSA 1853]KAJ2566621.1 mRNA splicing protein [Coemansia sp. RSA 1822]